MSLYQQPYFEYEPDPDTDESEIGVACPICGDPSDYCQDHNHWFCDGCEEPLEIVYDVNDNAIWKCELCDD